MITVFILPDKSRITLLFILYLNIGDRVSITLKTYGHTVKDKVYDIEEKTMKYFLC